MSNRIYETEQLAKTVEALKDCMFGEKIPLKKCMDASGLRCKKVPYGHRSELLGDYLLWDEFEPGSSWGNRDEHYLFRTKIEIPDFFEGKEVFFFLSTGADDIWNTDNPQMLVYVNGVRRCGMDMNHNCLSIYSKKDWEKGSDRLVDIGIYAYSNLSENENLLNIEIGALDESAMQLYFDMLVPFEAAKEFDETGDTKKADVILNELARADEISGKGKGNAVSLQNASEYLLTNLYGKGENPATVASIGHTHIDVAWKWQLKQTKEKVIRSYSTVMELMKRYPEYLFMASTPQMYEFVRNEEPELFEEIKEKVSEKRFEPEGAMWLEADCNITGGESLVRQILYGKQYFKDTFGVSSDILWLPDVFGYSAAMPQILRKSGIRIFMTTKLAWNDTNRMPHDLFMWKGIDGSDIPAYIITTCDYSGADRAMKDGGRLEYTYNGRQNASQIMGTYRAFREKKLTDEVLTCFGFGDGGGGPTWEMLEMNRRLELGIPGAPRTKIKPLSDFVDGLMQRISDSPDMPVWKDELYLEYHRGTYTSMGRNKKYNRMLEYLLHEAEVLSSYAYLLMGTEYPRKELLEVWKTVMLNQFHDILPGSSIEGVYTDSWEQYKEAVLIVHGVIDKACEALKQENVAGLIGESAPGGYVPLESTDVSGDMSISGRSTYIVPSEPGMSYEEYSGGKLGVHTDYYDVKFDLNGEIESLFDKELKREIRDNSSYPLNRLIAFEDKPKDYDAWNIDADFEKTFWNLDKLEKMQVVCLDRSGNEIKGVQKGNDTVSEIHVEIHRKFNSSNIHQTIVFRKNQRRIDFRTKADWHEHQILLKAAFPVNVQSDKIRCEIQYGDITRSLKRDTTWEKAKFECCAHKWIDITDDSVSYGVAVLNDCKYGYDAKEKLMRLTLIKSGIFPNPNADQGEHEFTYSLLPHKGNVAKGEVIEQARRLNFETHYYLPKEFSIFGQGSIKGVDDLSAVSAATLVNGIESEIIDFSGSKGVFVEAVKIAEEKESLIIRIYEGYGLSHDVRGKLFKNHDICLKNAVVCDLLENDTDEEISFDRDTKAIGFKLKPYEIKTIRLEFA